MMTAFQLIFQYQGHHHADNAHYQSAEESGPEAVNREVNLNELADLSGKPEQESVNQQGKQAEG